MYHSTFLRLQNYTSLSRGAKADKCLGGCMPRTTFVQAITKKRAILLVQVLA